MQAHATIVRLGESADRVMKDNLIAWSVGPVLLLLGLAIYLSPRLDTIPFPDLTAVDASQIDPGPLRKPMSDPPILLVAGYQKDCMDCHALFQSKTKTPFAMFQHQDIQQAMDHGINTRCFNCHDLKAADKLLSSDGTSVGFDQAGQVCAKCHGTTYRDWQRGSHGKTVDYWDKSRGQPDRHTCTQCHDPHTPAFDEFQPLPGPHTLRMKEIPRTSGHERARKKVNPLRIWSSPNGPHVERSHLPSGSKESGVESGVIGSEEAQSEGTGQETSHE
jgi:hypothetical protein